ncbi:uncharacterized protein BKA78DRAFT_354687 [Phyllosticta capitalensis]|uniref:Uncharacterized protein n=1 Tax=Phyllosticta capitalensis TaxID=121624 RepID=A0ABR1Y9A6_9PEZI
MGAPPRSDAEASSSAHSSSAQFERDCIWANNALLDFNKLYRSETARLRLNAQHLKRENRLLHANLNEYNNLTAAVLIVKNDVPLRSLSMPLVSLYDELAPLLSDLIEEYEEGYNHHPSFVNIEREFSRAQCAYKDISDCGQAVVDLATKNHALRMEVTDRIKGHKKRHFNSNTD